MDLSVQLQTRLCTVAHAFLFLVLLLNEAAASEEMDTLQCQRKNSHLWKISTTPPVYLFGTMHVPYSTLWNYIPENVKTAFSSSKELCLELKLLDQNTARDLTNCRLLPRDQNIENLLSASTIARITSYLEKIKKLLPKWMGHSSGGNTLFASVPTSEQLFNAMVGDWKKMKPVWLLYLLNSLTEQKIKLQQTPVVDVFLERAAEKLGKNVQAVEKPGDHCKPLNNLSKEQVEIALRVQLDYLEMLVEDQNFNGPQSSLEKDINSYRCGDFADYINHVPFLPVPPLENITTTSPNITKAELDTLRSAEEYLFKYMVVRRNRKMARQIDMLLQSERNNSFFLGLGAGHYLSKKNVIHRLRKKGYIVEHIPAEQDINGTSLPENFVQLGDPNSKSGLLHIPRTQPPASQPSHYGSLSADRLADIFNRLFGTQPSTTPTSTTTTSSGSHLRIRSSNQKVKIHSRAETDSMWEQGVSELLQFQSKTGMNNSGKND